MKMMMNVTGEFQKQYSKYNLSWLEGFKRLVDSYHQITKFPFAK